MTFEDQSELNRLRTFLHGLHMHPDYEYETASNNERSTERLSGNIVRL